MLEKRKFPRYEIRDDIALSGCLATDRRNDRLHIIGLGGCGFYSSASEPKLQLKEKVRCHLEWPGQIDGSLELEGHIVYVSEESPSLYYGVEFLEDERKRIVPVIQKLEKLVENQKIYRTSFVKHQEDS